MAHRATAVTTGTGATIAATKPTGTAAGDYLGCWVVTDDFSKTPAVSGFTQRADASVATPDGQSARFFDKIATGSEGATISVTGLASGDTTIIMFALSGRDGTNPRTFTPHVTTRTSDASSPISISDTVTGTAAAGDDVVVMYMVDAHGIAGWSFTAPSGYTQQANQDAAWVPAGLATKDNVAAGALGTLTATATNSGNAGGWGMVVLSVAQAAGGGGTNTPKTITVGQSQTIVTARALGLARSATEAQSLIRMLGLARLITGAGHTQTASRSRTIVPTTLTRTATQAPSRGAQAIGKPASATATQTPSVAGRAIGLVRLVTAAASLVLARALALGAKSVSQSQTPSLTKGQGYFKTLTASIAQAATRVRAVGLPRAATAAQSASRSAAIGRRIAVTASQSLTVLRGLARALSATISATPSASEQQSGGSNTPKSLSATAVQVPTMVRAIARGISGGGSQTPSLRPRTLGIGRTGAGTQSPAIARALARPLAAVASGAASVRRALGMSRAAAATQSGFASSAAGAVIPLTLIAIAQQVASLVRAVRRLPRAGYCELLPLDVECSGELAPLDVEASATLLPLDS